MPVQRTQIGHQTRFTLSGTSGPGWALEYGSVEMVPSAWKILRIGPDGEQELLATARFPAPDEQSLREWLTHSTGAVEAAELAAAARAEPPKTSSWRSSEDG
jgi:hypothetical protein